MVRVLYDDTTNGAIGIEMKRLKTILKAIPGKHSIELLQQTTIFGT